jgi:hypothetical protein
VFCCGTVEGGGGEGATYFIFETMTLCFHPIYYFLNVFSAGHMSPVILTGREKFVDVLANNSTFKKRLSNDLSTTLCLQILCGTDSMAITSIVISQLSVVRE